MIYDKCKKCPGECPENCRYCIYKYCKKLVDFALVDYHYKRMINAIDTSKERERDREFRIWWTQYFKYELL